MNILTRTRRKLPPAAMTPDNQRAIGYIRGSTDKQRITIPTQGAEIGRYTEYETLEMVCNFIDSGTCGKTPFLERAIVRDMVEFMAENSIRNIVCTRLDRAFRSTADAIITIDTLQKHGIALHFASHRINPTTAMGRAQMQMIALFAELETNLRAERQVETFATHRAAHYRSGRNVPYGWTAVPSATGRTTRVRRADGSNIADDLIPNWEQQDVLAQILARHAAGCTDSQIALILNEAKIPTQKGKAWQTSTVYSVRSFARVAIREEWK